MTMQGGSPPQAWGRRPHRRFIRQPHRFTPTGVGTADGDCSWALTRPVHPHRRGDGDWITNTVSSRHGSPPQAWGRRIGFGLSERKLRFTPTGVGTARWRPIRWARAAVHPHRRGDGLLGQQVEAVEFGSPPQAWGRRYDLPRAGPPRAVHPHRRGDGVNLPLISKSALGSPPQAWGRPYQMGDDGSVTRFTPTGVGTARAAITSRSWTSVHPHRRGDGLPTSSF